MPALVTTAASARHRRTPRRLTTTLGVAVGVLLSLLPVQQTTAAAGGSSEQREAAPFVPTVENLGAEGVHLDPPTDEPEPAADALPAVVDMVPRAGGGSGDDVARLLSTPGSPDSRVAADGAGRLSNRNAKARFTFADRADAEAVVRTGGKGWSVGFGLDGAAPSPAEVDGNRVTYPDVFPDVDLVYVVAGGHVKELLRVETAEAAGRAGRVTAPLRLTGVRAVAGRGGAVEFRDTKNKVRAVMPAGVAVDAAGATTPVRYELLDGRAVAVVTDQAWLNDAARAFPILIDPTLAGSAPSAPANSAPANGGTVGSLTPTLTATYSDPDAETGTCTFYVTDVLTNTQVWSGSSLTVASNTACSATVGANVLSNGRSYRWYATGRDATGLVGPAGATWTFRVAMLPTVTKTRPSTIVARGETVPYTVTVTNPGGAPMRVNGLTDVLPSGLAATGVAVTNPGTPPSTCRADAAPPEPACSIVAYPGGAGRDAVSGDAPDAWWRLDDPAGTVAADASGNGRTGAYVGVRASTPGAIAADTSTAATFNGVDSVVTVAHNTALDLERDASFTVEAWVKTTSTATQVLASKMNEDTLKRGWQLFLENGVLNFHQASDVATGNWVGVRGVRSINDNAWHHVAVTRSASGASGLTLFVDGVADTTVAYQDGLTTTSLTPATMRLGARSGLQFLTGALDEAALYQPGLSAADIAEHATTGTRTSQVRVGAFTLAGNAARTFTITTVATGVPHPVGTSSGTNTGDCTAATIQNEIAADALATDAYEQTIKTDNPSEYLRLGETAGTTAANLIGSSGTYTGGVTLGATGALTNDRDRAPRLDGTSGYVALPAGQANFTTGFSVSAWVYPTTAANSAKVVDFANGAALDNIFLGRSGTTNALQLGVHDGTTLRTITSPAKLVQNQWQHVAATVSSTGAGVVYHNGIAVISGSVGIPTNTSRASNLIGKSNNAAHSHWAGGQDEIAVYRSVLSAARLKAHYEAGTASVLARRVAATGIQVCENRLGIEDWWSYVSREVGPNGSAKVNVSNGNLVLQQEDSTRSQAHGHLALGLRRTYNSLDTGRLTLPNSLGSGWTLDVGQVGGTVGAGVTAGSLYVPAPTSALDQVLQALPITLVDRDGTRHQFQPKRLAAAVDVPLLATGPLAPKALVRGGVALCVDQTYTAPPGVHLSMWRYVQVNGGTCSNVTSATSQVLGYAGIRADRLRYEFSATGELLSMADASGVELRYLYDSVPALPTTGLPAALGRLRAVFEATAPACKKQDGSVPAVPGDVQQLCRALELTWTGSPNPSHVTILDAAERTTTYLLSGTTPNYLMGIDNPDGTTIRHTYQGVTWNGGTGACFSPVNGQLCSVTDTAGRTTAFTYRAASVDGFNSAQRPVLRTVVDRKGNTTTFAYTSGNYTIADMNKRRQRFEKFDAFGRSGMLSEGDDTNAFVHQSFFAWDGVPDPTRPTPDVAVDPTRTGCRSDDKGLGHAGNVVANNLCRTVRKAVVTPLYPAPATRSTTAADDDRRFVYNPEGATLLEKQSDRAPSATTTGADPGPTYNIVRTWGHQAQYTPGTGASSVYRDVVSGNGQHLTATRTAAAAAVYYLSDETESLTPRGNHPDNASTFSTYRTTHVVDGPQPPTATTTSYAATPVAPNTFDVAATTCGPAGTATRNTGLVCETAGPGKLVGGAAVPARTHYRYNGYGQRISEVRPNVVADPTNPEHITGTDNLACPMVESTTRRACYSYVYYEDTTLDLSGNVSVGGWLKAVVDPKRSFVAHAYDRAGNVVRTWDRTATAASLVPVTGGWGNNSAPAPNYVETLYGPRPGAPVEVDAAYKYPWRWELSTTDQVGGKTTYVVDGNGNRTRITPPRGNVPGNVTDYSTVQTFDNNDNLATRSSPRDRALATPTSWKYTYDSHDNKTVEEDPLGRKRIFRYDSVNRTTRVRWSRGTNLAVVPTGCPALLAADTDGFGAGTNVCDTATGYDHLDNVTKSWEPNQDADVEAPNVTSVYDAAGRELRKARARNHNGITELVSLTAYDVDGNAVAACTPRQVAEGGTSSAGPCPASPRFGERREYDPAGRLVEAGTVRNQTSGGDIVLETTTGYDDNGNTVVITNANGTAVTMEYNSLDRRVKEWVPRLSNADKKDTTYQYNESGDTTVIDRPGSATARRITRYTYDPAHRVVERVVGAPAPTSACTAADDATVAGSTSGCNIRTKTVYDADGHAVAQYDPRAFIGNPVTPNAEFMARTDFDVNGMPVVQHVPRYGAGGNPAVDDVQATQCPTSTGTPPPGTPSYPAGVGVCVSRVEYDLVGNRTKLFMPTTTPGSGSTARMANYEYTPDNLVSIERTPSPARTGTDTISESVTNYFYNGNANPLEVHLPQTGTAARRQVFTYSADNLVVSTSMPSGDDPGGAVAHTTSATYNANGQVLTEVDGNGRTTATSYYTDGQKLDLLKGSGTAEAMTTRYGYDNVGNVTQVFSPSAMAGDTNNPHGGSFTQGLAAVNRYTADNLLRKTFQPVSSTLGTLSTGAGSAWRVTDYAYDDGGRKTTVTTTTGTATPGADTAPANDTVVLTASAGNQTFGYFPSDRIQSETGRSTALGGTGALTTGYDPAGNVTSITDTTNVTSPTNGLGSCDANGTVVGGDPMTTICAKYYADNLVRTVDDGAWANTYAYDGAGTITGRRDRNKATAPDYDTKYGNNDAGLPVSILSNVFGSNRTTTRTYDVLGRPATQKDPNPSSLAGQQEVAWSFNADDTLRKLTVNKGGTRLAEWTYTYNGNYQQLTQGFVGRDPGGTVDVTRNFTYQYNDGGNRLTAFTDVAAGETSYTKWDHDNNRLGWGPNASQCGTTVPAAPTTCFTYRADDSMASSTTNATTTSHTPTAFGGTAADDCADYTFDGFDRLTKSVPKVASTCGQKGVTYKYDSFDRQRERTDDFGGAAPTVSRTTYDGLGRATVAELPTAAGADPVVYELDASGAPMAYRSGTEIQFLTTNGAGDVTTVTSDSTTANSLVCTARFDPFGGGRQQGPTPCSTANTKNDFFYRGGRRDDNNGKYQFGSRHYDPSKSAFLTPDSYRTEQPDANLSIGTDPLTRNTYTYVNGDPVNFSDPNGHEPCYSADSAYCNYLYTGDEKYAAEAEAYRHRAAFARVIGSLVHGTSPNALDVEGRTWSDAEIEVILAAGRVGCPGCAGSTWDQVIAGVVTGHASDIVWSNEAPGEASLVERLIIECIFWCVPAFRMAKAAITGATKVSGRSLARKAGEEVAEESADDILAKPIVNNEKLRNIINDLYKGTTKRDRVGTGTTADALRNEVATGMATGGKFHREKAEIYLNGLKKVLKKDLDPHDRLVAQSLLDDLVEALSRTMK